MTVARKAISGVPGARVWLGIPFAAAERFQSPQLVAFDPDRPYDRKGVAPFQPDSGAWLGTDSGMGEDCSTEGPNT